MVLIFFLFFSLTLQASDQSVEHWNASALEFKHSASQQQPIRFNVRAQSTTTPKRPIVRSRVHRPRIPLRQHLESYKRSARQTSYEYRYHELREILEQKQAALKMSKGNDATRLKEEIRILEAELRNPTGKFLDMLAHADNPEAMKAWANLQALESQGKLGKTTWGRAQHMFQSRSDLQQLAHDLEERTREAREKQATKGEQKGSALELSTKSAVGEVTQTNNEGFSFGKLEDTTDMRLTTPSKIVNIHPEVDQHVEETLCGLSEQHSDFESYMDATITALEKMQVQGLLVPKSSTSLDVLKHGAKHYFISLIPTNPLEHPGTYTANLIRYTALAGIHTATSGVLLPVHVAADVALKLHAIQSADTARMTSEQYAEFVAEELADITYQVAANKVASTVKDSGIPQGFVRMTREMLKGDPEAAIAGGGSASASATAPEEPSLQTFAKKKGHDGSAGNEAGNATNVLKQEGQNVKGGSLAFKPLGLGSTGRSAPANLHEQLVLEEIMSNPTKGSILKLSKGMTDSRWPKDQGWMKMLYYNKQFDVEIHYVAKWENGILKAIDDLKFK